LPPDVGGYDLVLGARGHPRRAGTRSIFSIFSRSGTGRTSPGNDR